MIDNPEQAERLLTRLQAALPVPARMTPELAATLRTPDAAMAIPAACSVIAVHYAVSVSAPPRAMAGGCGGGA